jgi:hypothetical protein
MPCEYRVGDKLETHHANSTEDKTTVFTHKAFSIAYNGDRVIEVSLEPVSPHPKPQNLKPKPETSIRPETLILTHYNNPKPCTIHPKPHTLNPKPSTLNPKP